MPFIYTLFPKELMESLPKKPFLRYANNDFINTFNEGLMLCKEAPLLFADIKSFDNAGYRAAIEKSKATGNIDEMMQTTKKLNADPTHQAYIALNTRLRYQKKLLDDALWEDACIKRIAFPLALKQVKELKASYRLPLQWALYSSEALLYVDDTVQVLATMALKARSEYQRVCKQYERRKKPLPDEIEKAGQYWESASIAIRDKQAELKTLMAHRIQTGIEGSQPYLDEIMAPLENKLIELKITLSGILPALPFREMKLETLCQLYQRAAPIQQVASTLKLKAVSHEKTTYLVPDALAGLIPPKPSKAPFLFRDTQHCWEYFQNDPLLTQLLLHLSVKPLSVRPTLLLASCDDVSWQALAFRHEQLQDGIDRVQQQIKTGVLDGFFYKKFNTLLSSLQSLLIEQQIATLNKQLEFIQGWLPGDIKKIPVTRRYFSTSETLALTEMLGQAKDITQKLTASRFASTLSTLNEIKSQLQGLDECFQQVKAQDVLLPTIQAAEIVAENALDEIIKNPNVPAPVYKTVLDYYRSLSCEADEMIDFNKRHAKDWRVLQAELAQHLQNALTCLTTAPDTKFQFNESRVQSLYNFLFRVSHLAGNLNWTKTINILVGQYQAYLESLITLPIEEQREQSKKAIQFELLFKPMLHDEQLNKFKYLSDRLFEQVKQAALEPLPFQCEGPVIQIATSCPEKIMAQANNAVAPLEKTPVPVKKQSLLIEKIDTPVVSFAASEFFVQAPMSESRLLLERAQESIARSEAVYAESLKILERTAGVSKNKLPLQTNDSANTIAGTKETGEREHSHPVLKM